MPATAVMESMKLPILNTLRITLFPDPILRKACAPVREFGGDLKSLADRMLVLMREAKGVGLAAPQIGLSIRLFVCNVTEDAANDMVFVNPVFEERTGAIDAEEGCLSIPGVNVMMRRATRVVMKAYDAYGKSFERTDEQLLARVWQHETDHLDGKLIVDNMSATDEIANRRALKQLEADYAAARKR